MQSFTEVIARLGGPEAVAPIIGAKADTVRKMSERDSVPPEYWPALIDVARDKRVRGITLAKLAKMKRPRKVRSPSDPKAKRRQAA